jgi:hypothetical protein
MRRSGPTNAGRSVPSASDCRSRKSRALRREPRKAWPQEGDHRGVTSALRVCLLPSLGDKPLDRVTRADVTDLMATMSGAGLGPKSAARGHRFEPSIAHVAPARARATIASLADRSSRQASVESGATESIPGPQRKSAPRCADSRGRGAGDTAPLSTHDRNGQAVARTASAPHPDQRGRDAARQGERSRPRRCLRAA